MSLSIYVADPAIRAEQLAAIVAELPAGWSLT